MTIIDNLSNHRYLFLDLSPDIVFEMQLLLFLFIIISSESFSVHRRSLSWPERHRFGYYPSTSRLMAVKSSIKQNKLEQYTGGGRNRVNSHIGDSRSRWRIWSVIDELQTNGLSSSSSNSRSNSSLNSDNEQYDNMIKEVIQILTQWGVTWAGQDGWATLLDKTTLYHEVEESIIALHFLVEWLQQRNEQTAITLVDVCCGKGILSMLATYLFRDKTDAHVSNIIMLDKQEDINWNHIKAANEHAKEERRPTITSWGGCNLHEIDTIVDKLETDTTEPLAIIGIHLCKQLSPACVGVVNALGKKKCPYVCLAPCCLPRMVRNLSKAPNNSGMIPNRGRAKQKNMSSFTIPVRVYESVEERQARKESNKRREMAKKRTFKDVPCYLCSEMQQSVAGE